MNARFYLVPLAALLLSCNVYAGCVKSNKRFTCEQTNGVCTDTVRVCPAGLFGKERVNFFFNCPNGAVSQTKVGGSTKNHATGAKEVRRPFTSTEMGSLEVKVEVTCKAN